MGQIPEDIYTLAKRFFEQDYHDRGMVKWQGFYLSDHTEDAAQYSSEEMKRAKQQLHDRQTPEYISRLMKKAYDGQLDVSVQLAVKDETGLTGEVIAGKIKGYTAENTIIINDSEVSIDQVNALIIEGY